MAGRARRRRRSPRCLFVSFKLQRYFAAAVVAAVARMRHSTLYLSARRVHPAHGDRILSMDGRAAPWLHRPLRYPRRSVPRRGDRVTHIAERGFCKTSSVGRAATRDMKKGYNIPCPSNFWSSGGTYTRPCSLLVATFTPHSQVDGWLIALQPV